MGGRFTISFERNPMANSLNTQPIVVDTDLANFGTSQTLQSRPFGVRIYKMALQVVDTSVAGTVTITNPIDGATLLPSMVVAAAGTAGTLLYFDNITDLLTWKNFAVTGVTATHTRLFLWYRS